MNPVGTPDAGVGPLESRPEDGHGLLDSACPSIRPFGFLDWNDGTLSPAWGQTIEELRSNMIRSERFRQIGGEFNRVCPNPGIGREIGGRSMSQLKLGQTLDSCRRSLRLCT